MGLEDRTGVGGTMQVGTLVKMSCATHEPDIGIVLGWCKHHSQDIKVLWTGTRITRFHWIDELEVICE